MDPAVASGMLPAPNTFRDGLGDRRRITDPTGESLELLCLRRELTAIPSFEFALRERTSRLATFRHTYYGRVRSIDRLSDPAATLAVASDFTRGVRLAQLLTPADGRPVLIDINASLHLIRQLVSAVAMLHESAHDVAHGAIAPERIIVTSNARIVIVEYVLGAALEQLHYSPEQYWRELRVALPQDSTRFDQRADVTQIGVVALSLVLGRLVTEDEYPSQIREVLASAHAISSRGGYEPLPAGVRAWIGRALQLDPRHTFESALEARAELDKVLAGEDEEDYEQLAAAPTVAPAMTYTAYQTSALQPDPAVDVVEQLRASAEEVRLKAEEGRLKADEIRRRAEEARLKAEEARLKPDAAQATQAQATQAHAPVAPRGQKTSAHAPKTEPIAVHPGALSIAPHAAALEPLAASDVEAAVDMTDETPSGARRWQRAAIAAAVLVAVAAGGGLIARKFFATPVAAATTGTLTITTNPPGAVVLVDNESRGATPLSVSLRPGPHVVVLRGSGEPRTIPVTIAAGAETSQYIELPVASAAATVGQLQIKTEPAGAQVMVDGVARGRSPVLVDNLTPGEHTVQVDSDLGTVKQTVTIDAATTASLVVPLSVAGAPVSGWVSLSTPVEVQIFENKRLLGTSASDRVMVSAGRHELELVNEPLGYHSTAVVQVPAGRVAPIKIDWPRGTASLNATPWAEVWIDGDKLGETPIGNVSLPIGPHEVVFRHPELGEQRYPVSVTMKGPARLSVDMRKKP